MQNWQKPSSEDLTKRADELNIGVKISKINLVPAEKLTPFLFYFVKFARYGRWAWYEGLGLCWLPCYNIVSSCFSILFNTLKISVVRLQFHFNPLRSTKCFTFISSIPSQYLWLHLWFHVSLTGQVELTFTVMWSMSFGVTWQQTFLTTHNAFL